MLGHNYFLKKRIKYLELSNENLLLLNRLLMIVQLQKRCCLLRKQEREQRAQLVIALSCLS